MNCEEFRNLVQPIARDEALDTAVLESALGHADSCGSCDDLLEEAEALTSDLQALAAHYGSEGAPPRVQAQLAAAVEQRREPESLRSRSSWVSAAAIGVAAEIVLACRRQSGAILGAAAAAVLVLAISGRPAGLWHPSWVASVGHSGEMRAGSEPSIRPQLNAQTTDVDANLSADSFVPLSGTYDLASLSDDPIVRVVLSDNDLETLGLPVGTNGNEQIVADLIIAHDGTPQAIRVVSW
jgi:hypothetical protein